MISLKSPAKINLFLRVLAKRADGYHELASLFQTVDLYDRISLSLNEEDKFYCSDSSIPTDARNLVCRAINLFKNKTGLNFHLKIDLEKNIPAMAGLGGGSSNAATTLFALNRLLNTRIPMTELSRWGAELGSDISFFFSAGTAYCTGRGEIIEPLEQLAQCSTLYLVKPPFGISTALVFKNLSVNYENNPCPRQMLSAFCNSRPHFHNDLENPACSLEPNLIFYKKKLKEIGFYEIFMTGSGSTLCCIGQPILPLSLPFQLFQEVRYTRRSLNEWY